MFKRNVTLAVLVALVMVMGLMSSAAAEEEERSPYDMWKGEFVTFNSNHLEDGGGEVIINYIRGQRSYMVNINVFGLDPEEQYEAWLMTTAGYGAGIHSLLGTLTVDAEGYGRLFNNRIASEDLADYLANDNIRVVVYQLPRVWNSWVLTTTAGGQVDDGDFQPVDSERGTFDCEE